MNREEKHELVIKLYKEGKTMREIAKVVHMSFADIGKIIKKLKEELEPESKEKSKESQALELFKKGKNPVDVSITMDLNPAEVIKIYNQFWQLKGLYKLVDLYKAVNADTSLIKVHDVMKKYNLTKKDIINIVNWADEYNFLEEEVQEMGEQFKDLLMQRRKT